MRFLSVQLEGGLEFLWGDVLGGAAVTASGGVTPPDFDVLWTLLWALVRPGAPLCALLYFFWLAFNKVVEVRGEPLGVEGLGPGSGGREARVHGQPRQPDGRFIR